MTKKPGLEADQSGGENRGRHVWGKRQANCARQCDTVREDTSVRYFPLALCVTNGIQH